MDNSFSFFPFGTLFCITLFCFIALRIYVLRYRDRTKHIDHLKELLIKGEINEEEYHRMKNLLRGKENAS